MDVQQSTGVEDPRARAAALRRAWLRWSLGAGAAMLVGGFLAAGFVAARYEARLGQMAREAARLEAEVRRLAGAQALLRLLENPATRVVDVSGTGPAVRAHGRLLWGPDGGRMVLVDLPALPSDRVYRAWIVRDGRARDAGGFRPDAFGRAVHSLPPLDGPVEAVRVTVEPPIGASAPSGPLVLSAALPDGPGPDPGPTRGRGILGPR